MNPTVDDELIGILKNSSLSIDTKSKGWSYILGLSATSDGLRHLISSNKYIPFMVSFIQSENDERLMILAFQSLINISAKVEGTRAIISRKGICNYLLTTICGPNAKFVENKCYLLSNISTSAEVIEQIVFILLSSKGLYQSLVNIYLSDDDYFRSQYDCLALVFANVSRVTAGRRLFLQDTEFLTSILKLLKPSEPGNRRLGAAFILRNCCFVTEYHDKLLHQIGIFPELLLPLMAPQEYERGGEMGELPPEIQKRCLEEDEPRERSASVRRVLVETLAILCYSEDAWRYLKTNGTYYVVRDLHTWETDEECKEIIEQLVAFLLIVDYTKPSISESYSEDNNGLLEQLEHDITRDLPNIVLQPEEQVAEKELINEPEKRNEIKEEEKGIEIKEEEKVIEIKEEEKVIEIKEEEKITEIKEEEQIIEVKEEEKITEIKEEERIIEVKEEEKVIEIKKEEKD